MEDRLLDWSVDLRGIWVDV